LVALHGPGFRWDGRPLAGRVALPLQGVLRSSLSQAQASSHSVLESCPPKTAIWNVAIAGRRFRTRQESARDFLRPISQRVPPESPQFQGKSTFRASKSCGCNARRLQAVRLSRNFRSLTRESALRDLLFRGFSGMKAAPLTRVEHTTARCLLGAVRSVLRCDSFSWLR